MGRDKELVIKDVMEKWECVYREKRGLKEMVWREGVKGGEKEVYEGLLCEKDGIMGEKEGKMKSVEEGVWYVEGEL